ncbi:MAG: CDP-archaeol synthase [Desulfobacteraceae bacterium]|nr:CDP-archaeol synthase [Desulfobacteraceae bacterium]
MILDWKKGALLLLVLGWCNFLPIVASLCLKERLSLPVDMGAIWFDKRPLFGPHKTWRGLLFSILGTALACSLVPALGMALGARMAVLSMSGDLLSSFIKRRLGLRPGRSAIGLDQGLESFLPLAGIRGEFDLGWLEIFFWVFMFLILEIIISPILYKFHIRHDPY